jgi:hypothetical protein
MGAFGCCCGGETPCSCTVDCDPYLPDPTWTIEVLGRTIVMTRRPERCIYLGTECYHDEAVEVNDWEIDLSEWVDDLLDVGDPEVDPPAPPCPVSCCSASGLSNETIETQIAVKVRQKRWRQTYYRIDAQVFPVNDAGDKVSSASCTTKLRLRVTYSVVVVYFTGGSATAWVRWRKKTVTCGDPATETVGSWNYGSQPAMPTVEKPNLYLFCFTSLCPPAPGIAYQVGFDVAYANGCVLERGPEVACDYDWETSVVTTLNELYCNGYGACATRTVDARVPNDIAEQLCFTPYAISTILAAIAIDPFYLKLCNVSQPLYDRTLEQSYDYISEIFDCSDIPYGDISLSTYGTFPAYPPASGSGFFSPCGAEAFSYEYPTVEPSTITATI